MKNHVNHVEVHVERSRRFADAGVFVELGFNVLKFLSADKVPFLHGHVLFQLANRVGCVVLVRFTFGMADTTARTGNLFDH